MTRPVAALASSNGHFGSGHGGVHIMSGLTNIMYVAEREVGFSNKEHLLGITLV